jgi:hypothetical protein
MSYTVTVFVFASEPQLSLQIWVMDGLSQYGSSFFDMLQFDNSEGKGNQ